MTRFPNGVSAFVYTRGSILALPQTAASTIATISGGRILLSAIVGEVTTIIGAVANATKLKATATGLTAVDLCATVELNAAAALALLTITGTVANALIKNTNRNCIFQATPQIISSGIIAVDCAGSDGGTGRVQWTWLWTPIDPAATLVAA
jgi:hypothetical protein